MLDKLNEIEKTALESLDAVKDPAALEPGAWPTWDAARR